MGQRQESLFSPRPNLGHQQRTRILALPFAVRGRKTKISDQKKSIKMQVFILYHKIMLILWTFTVYISNNACTQFLTTVQYIHYTTVTFYSGEYDLFLKQSNRHTWLRVTVISICSVVNGNLCRMQRVVTIFQIMVT